VEALVEEAVDADEVDDIWDGGVLKAMNQNLGISIACT